MRVLKVDKDNYFDIAEALHAYLTLSHAGQWSAKYSLLCQSEFRPGRLWQEYKVVADNPYYAEISCLSDTDLESLMNQVKAMCD